MSEGKVRSASDTMLELRGRRISARGLLSDLEAFRARMGAITARFGDGDFDVTGVTEQVDRSLER